MRKLTGFQFWPGKGMMVRKGERVRKVWVRRGLWPPLLKTSKTQGEGPGFSWAWFSYLCRNCSGKEVSPGTQRGISRPVPPAQLPTPLPFPAP